MKQKKKTGILLSLIITVTASLSAFAKSPEFARPAEEWAHLRDNTLEWYEIADLVKEYNATVLQNEAKYNADDLKLRTAQDTNEALTSMADSYEFMAMEAENTTGGALTAASYRMMADQLRSQAEENVSDNQVVHFEYERAEREIAKNVQELFVNYYKQQLLNAQDQKNIAYLERVYNSKQNLQRNGMGTQLEVLTALENLQKAQAAAITDDALLSSDYRKLITLCGWQYDAPAVIGPMPELDPAALASVDYAASAELALSNSITLRSDERKLANAREYYGGATSMKAAAQLAADQNNVKSNFNTAYNSLLLAKATYDNACAQAQVQATNLAQAARQLNLGVISQVEYVAVEYAYDQAVTARDVSLYDLIISRIGFDAAVNGLA